MLGLALVLLVPSPAQATRLAGLKLVPGEGPPGSRVRVTGTWFAAAGEDFASADPVELRWGGHSGPVLARVQPDAGGTFITQITVPAGAGAGQHVLVATQTVVDHRGRALPAPGTPAKAAFRVRTGKADLRAHQPGLPAASAAAGRGGVGLPLLLAGLLGLAIFAGAVWMLVLDQARTPAPARRAGPRVRFGDGGAAHRHRGRAVGDQRDGRDR